jgi:peptidoglycan/LPS O-acetylase OafA/YrhL
MATEAIGGLESSVPERSAGRHYPCFDGFRAIAAMSVLVTHVALISGLNVRSQLGPYLARLDAGVAVFFLISGFLLYRPFVSARLNDRRRPDPVRFLWRRALRIFPAYWLALVLVIFVFRTTPIHGAAGYPLHFLLLQIYSPHRVVGGPVQQGWTLAIEITFYAFIPLYAWLMSRVARTFRAEMIGCAVLYAISLVWRIGAFELLKHHVLIRGMVTTWLPAFFDQFALGMGLAALSVELDRKRRTAPFGLERSWAPGVCWLLAAAMFWCSAHLGLVRGPVTGAMHQELGRQFFYGMTAFFLLMPGIFGPQDRGIIRRALRNRVVQLTGLISYGIYLFHELWIDWYMRRHHIRPFLGKFWPMLAFDVVLTVITAAVSYVLVEKPALRFKDRPGFVARRT